MIKQLVAKMFGLVTFEDFLYRSAKLEEVIVNQKREYYQRVLNAMHRNGDLPPNTDLKMPKQSLRIESERGEIIAEKGRWLRLPGEGEQVTIKYND